MQNKINSADAVQSIRQDLLDKIALHERIIATEQASIAQVRQHLLDFDAMCISCFKNTAVAEPISTISEVPAPETVPISAPVFTTPSQASVKPHSKPRRPILVDAIHIVLGTKTMNASQVYEAMSYRGWLPTSQNPKNYISYTLSKNKTTFACVERGKYQAIHPIREEGEVEFAPVTENLSTTQIVEEEDLAQPDPNETSELSLSVLADMV